MSNSGWNELSLAVLATVLLAAGAAAQTAPAFTAEVSSDTVEMGEIFEFRVSVPVPAGSIVYFPDTLPATVNVESAARVRVETVPDGGGATLTLTYPMMAFGAGELPVPGFDLLMRVRGDEGGVLELPGGSATGVWDEAPRQAGSRLTRIPRQGVWVVPVLTPTVLAEGVEPMPPNDVAGANWSWPSLTLLILCGSLLVVTLVSTTKGFIDQAAGRSHPTRPPTPAERRRRALDELEALLDEGLHREGRLLDFYTRASGIVRRYVEGIEGSWPSSLTSTELTARVRSRLGDAKAGSLPTELASAEVVKFGRLRPDADTAERHGRALRDWISESEDVQW